MSWQCPLYEHSIPLRCIPCSGQPKSVLCSLQFFALPYYYIIPKFFKNRRKGKYNFPFHQIKPYLFVDFLIIIWRKHENRQIITKFTICGGIYIFNSARLMFKARRNNALSSGLTCIYERTLSAFVLHTVFYPELLRITALDDALLLGKCLLYWGQDFIHVLHLLG